MASLLKKLVNKRCSVRFLTTLTHQNTPVNFVPQLFPIQNSVVNQRFLVNPRNEEKEGLFVGLDLGRFQIYPNLSNGVLKDPVLVSGSGLFQTVRDGSLRGDVEDSSVIRADSVKKKRKKKMNKHKLKKLRKSLRRKTKA